MTTKKTTTCDACGTEIPPEHLHLRIVMTSRKPGRRKGISRASVVGERNAHAKLSDQQIDEIRRLGATCTERKLARMFPVNRSQIGRILRSESRALRTPTESGDERPIDREMLQLFEEPKDFCNLLCVQRLIESLGSAPLP